MAGTHDSRSTAILVALQCDRVLAGCWIALVMTGRTVPRAATRLAWSVGWSGRESVQP